MIFIIVGRQIFSSIYSDILTTLIEEYMLGTLTLQQMDELLHRNVTGRIGCHDGDRVYIVPVSYAFNDTFIIAHSREGLKIDMMRKNPQVCFEVDEIADLSNWKSVIAYGTYEEIDDEKERYYAMKFLVGRLMQLKVSETAGIPKMGLENLSETSPIPEIRPVVYRIRIEELTGRFETT